MLVFRYGTDCVCTDASTVDDSLCRAKYVIFNLLISFLRITERFMEEIRFDEYKRYYM